MGVICVSSLSKTCDFSFRVTHLHKELTSKRSKFNYKFIKELNSNVLMSIQRVPVSESAGKFPKFTFHLIKSVAVTQTRT